MDQNDSRQRIIDDLIADALELAPDQRDEFLSRACGNDRELRAQIESRLRETEHSEAPDSTLTIAGLRPAEVVAQRFRIIRFIASGGMGDVYEAEDLDLRMRKALKTIRPSIAMKPAMVARFKREIAIGHSVTHPNVCRVYDLGYHYSTPPHNVAASERDMLVLFMTMQLLAPGDTLTKYLRTHGRIDPEHALALIKHLAAGLHALHSEGYLHRDFKSSNVMLVGSEPDALKAVITDLGLARSFSHSAGTCLSLQQSGRSGTPPYMAPEQFTGEPLSPATDVYALGVVACEMLTGQLPFTGADARHNAENGPRQLAPLPRDFVSELDPRWERALLRCFERDPEKRFASVVDFIDALEPQRAVSGIDSSPNQALAPTPPNDTRAKKRPLQLALCLLLLLVAAFIMYRVLRRAPPITEPKHIAVLPFRNIGNDPGNQAFCEGLVETLTSNLSQMERYQKSFWVVPASSARLASNANEAYRRLNVTLVVTGSVQRTSDRIVVIASLVDSKDDHQLDSRTLSIPAVQLPTLPDHLWERVADMLDVQIDPRTAATVAAGTTQPGAYEFYEQGLGYLRRYGIDDNNRAIDAFGKALALDSSYALAYAGLGEAYSQKYELTKDPQWIERAKSNGEKAVQLHAHLPQVRLALGSVYYHTGQPLQAIEEFTAALRDDPASIEAYFYLGQIYEAQGKLDDAEQAYLTLVTRRSGYWLGYSALGTFYYHHGQFEKAAHQFQIMIDLQPDNALGYENMGGAELALAHYARAIDVLLRGLKIRETPNAWTNLGAAYMYLGNFSDAAPAMERAVHLNPSNHDLWRNLGDSYRRVPSLAPRANSAYREALKLARAQLGVDPDDADVLSSIALYEAHLGNPREALAFLPKALSKAPKDSGVLFTAALVYDIIGERQKALQALDKAAGEGFPLEEIEREPELEHLRSDVRYQRWIRDWRVAHPAQTPARNSS